MKATEFIHFLRTPCPGINPVDPLVWTSVSIILGDEITIIDSAYAGFWKSRLLPFLKRVNRDPHDVSLIIHTHSNGDHVGADEEIREATDAKVAISEAGAEALENPEKDRERRLAVFAHLLSKKEQEARRERASRRQLLTHHVDRRLKNNEVLDLGPLSLECITLHGHEFDQLGFYDQDEEILFSGDALFGRGAIRDTFVYMRENNIPAFYESMAMLGEMSIRMLLPSHNYLPYHGKPILRGREVKDMIEQTVYINNDVREMILRLLRTYSRPLGAAEMSSLIIPKLGPGYVIPNPGPDDVVLSHLDALIKENRVELVEKEESIFFRLKH